MILTNWADDQVDRVGVVVLVVATGERHRRLTSCIKLVSALEVQFEVCENAYFLLKRKVVNRVLSISKF